MSCGAPHIAHSGTKRHSEESVKTTYCPLFHPRTVPYSLHTRVGRGKNRCYHWSAKRARHRCPILNSCRPLRPLTTSKSSRALEDGLMANTLISYLGTRARAPISSSLGLARCSLGVGRLNGEAIDRRRVSQYSLATALLGNVRWKFKAGPRSGMCSHATVVSWGRGR